MRGREQRSDCCPRCRWTVSFEGHHAVRRCVAPLLAPQTPIQPTTSASERPNSAAVKKAVAANPKAGVCREAPGRRLD
jgi:hypothetical protein